MDLWLNTLTAPLSFAVIIALSGQNGNCNKANGIPLGQESCCFMCAERVAKMTFNNGDAKVMALCQLELI